MLGLRAWWVGTLLCVLVGARGAWAQTAAALPLLPSAVVSDAAGDLFIADRVRNQVLEATAAGSLLVVAGTGEQGSAGDGGQATAAELNGPQGLAMGSDGTLYIADTGNERVRAVSTAGVISTVVGNGIAGFSGEGGVATAAELRAPMGLAVEADGSLLIADSGNQRVRKVAGGVIATFAGLGVQGFGGDGGAATAAMLDTPSGLAVASDGRVFIADTHNQRVRVVAVDGTIATFAGDGHAGFAGDGGPAVSARLSQPRGVAVLPDGTVLVADAENQRLRAVSASGVISTVAGSGAQGASAEGAAGVQAALNSPRAVAASGFAQPVFADAGNRLVRALLGDSNVYSAAGLVGQRQSAVTLSAPGTAVYGAVRVTASVSGAAATPMGEVELSDGGVSVGKASLVNGSAEFSGVNAGSHAFSARYAGDGFNPAAVSGAVPVTVSAAPVVATANDVTMPYGVVVPALSGSLSGVLAQDAGRVETVFASPATARSAPGVYPITATLTGAGSGNYNVSMAAGSGAVHVVKAGSATTMAAPGAAYSGMPLTLTATVSPGTSGVPTGSVVFYDAGVPAGTAVVSGGQASAVLMSATAGTHAFTAAYSGDANFAGSTSAAMAATVGAMPDFAVAVQGSASQTVGVGTMAAFALQVGANPGPFSGAVSLSASGLPSGVRVTFAPATLVPGSGAVITTMSVPTATLLAQSGERWVWMVVVVPMLFVRRRRVRGVVCAVALCGLTGCGARTVPEAAGQSKSYVITVTGTGTNLAGAVVAHSAQVTLTVE